MVRNYQDLDVWERSMDLAEAIHCLSEGLPPEEKYGLTRRLRRAVVSVPANIAEGAERHGSREFVHFLSIASGSLAETETHLLLAARLGVLDAKDLREVSSQMEVLGRMLTALKRSLRRSLSA